MPKHKCGVLAILTYIRLGWNGRHWKTLQLIWPICELQIRKGLITLTPVGLYYKDEFFISVFVIVIHFLPTSINTLAYYARVLIMAIKPLQYRPWSVR